MKNYLKVWYFFHRFTYILYRCILVEDIRTKTWEGSFKDSAATITATFQAKFDIDDNEIDQNIGIKEYVLTIKCLPLGGSINKVEGRIHQTKTIKH